MSKFRTLFRYLMTPKKFHSRQRIEKIQRKAIKRQIKFVRKNSPFYARHWEGLSDDEWSKFPIIDKSIMMDNLADLLTVRIDVNYAKQLADKAEKTRDFSPKIGPYSIGYSSGTSGSRGMHFVSEKEQAGWAGFMLSRGLDRSIFERYKIGLILRANSNTYESVGSNRIKFKFYDLMQPLGEIHNKILDDELDILMGPPSVLSYFVDINSPIKVRKMVSVAEVLEEVDRVKIEQHFGLILHQFYSSTEGEIAATCEHGTLHLNEDMIIIQKEWIDEEKGWYHPIITDFRRKTQPIIRYRLNDILVTTGKKCQCGDTREVIDSIMGRSDDMFHLTTVDDTVELVVPDLIRRAIMQMSDEITNYIAFQKAPNQIEIQLKPEGLSNLSMEGFDELWKSKNIQPPQIEIAPYTHMPSTSKLRRIYRQFT